MYRKEINLMWEFWLGLQLGFKECNVEWYLINLELSMIKEVFKMCADFWIEKRKDDLFTKKREELFNEFCSYLNDKTVLIKVINNFMRDYSLRLKTLLSEAFRASFEEHENSFNKTTTQRGRYVEF